MADQPTVEERFDQLVAALMERDGVALGSGKRGFGSGALQADGRIFAMVTRGRIVLKLPPTRVSALISAGAGSPFDAGKGRPMREWVALEEGAYGDLLALAQEAATFVSGRDAPAPEL